MSALPAIVYDRSVAYPTHSRDFSQDRYSAHFDQEPPIEVFVDSAQVKDRIMEYFGAILARCWFDKKLLADLEYDAHRTLRHVGIVLPDELEIKFERLNQERPRMIIHEWNKERTFKRRVCYLQMIMLAGR
jgi:hypothetical protein